MKGECGTQGILHMTIAFDRKVENGKDSVTNQLIDDAIPFPYRLLALFVEVRQKPDDLWSVEKLRNARITADVGEKDSLMEHGPGCFSGCLTIVSQRLQRFVMIWRSHGM